MYTLEGDRVAFYRRIKEAEEVRMRMEAVQKRRGQTRLVRGEVGCDQQSGAPVVVGATRLTRELLHGTINGRQRYEIN